MSGNFTRTDNEWITHIELSVEPGIGTFAFAELLYRWVVDEGQEGVGVFPEPVFKFGETGQ